MEMLKKVLNGMLTPEKPPKIVVALNYVDAIEDYNWDKQTNLPSETQLRNINNKKRNTSARLREIGVRIPQDQIVGYSALQYYNLHELFSAMVKATEDGFILGGFKPRSFIEKADVNLTRDPRVVKALEERANLTKIDVRKLIDQHVKNQLPDADYRKVNSLYKQRLSKPPAIMLLGQAGVGKTTTVAGLLGKDITKDQLSISHVEIGTQTIEKHNIDYENGQIELYDLPGYGTIHDRDYYDLYQAVLPKCDVVLFVLKATNRMELPDQKMIKTVYKWWQKSEKERM